MAKSKPSKTKKHKKDKKATKPTKADKRVKKPKKVKHAGGETKAGAKTKAAPAKAAEVATAKPAKGRAEAKGRGAEHEKGPIGKPHLGPNGRPVRSRKSSRRPTLLRRGPDGEILAPGDLLLPGGTQRLEEVQYLFRGYAAAERSSLVGDPIAEVFARRPQGEFPSQREELQRALAWANDRFERGTIEAVIPPRTNLRRSFQGVVERARHRRREIGAFLRGLDLGHTETSHMDAHGEASLQSLMEWAARLENLAEADEPAQADYNQFHRGLDQLESTTEALILDVEQTLRRLHDRIRG